LFGNDTAEPGAVKRPVQCTRSAHNRKRIASHLSDNAGKLIGNLRTLRSHLRELSFGDQIVQPS
jgi:hypothetical protein